MNSDLGKKPDLAWLPVGSLSVDPKYQRDTGTRRSRRLIEKIADDFRWSRFGVVLAVKHGRGWHVIDGQHRVEACRMRGDIPRVPAVVLPHATVQAAAADFVAINRDRVNVTPLHIHHAQLAAGDPAAEAIDRACRAARVEICRYPVPANKMAPGQTLAVATIARLVRLRDEAFATKVLRRAFEDGGRIAGALSAKAIRFAAEQLGLGGRTAHAKPAAAGDARTRVCLSCRRPFASEGIHNRLCSRCKGGGD